MVRPKSSIATRKEMKVPKKPLANWMILVARIRIPICARSYFDCISLLPCNSFDDSRARARTVRGDRAVAIELVVAPDGLDPKIGERSPLCKVPTRPASKGNIFDHRLA
jgi:hypothetical protein